MMSKFTGAKACFAENINQYLPAPNRFAKMEPQDALMWNLNKGLHSLTGALEAHLAEIESRLLRVEQALQRSR